MSEDDPQLRNFELYRNWLLPSLAVVAADGNGFGIVMFTCGPAVRAAMDGCANRLDDLGLDDAPVGISIWRGKAVFHPSPPDGDELELVGEFRRPNNLEWRDIRLGIEPWIESDWDIERSTCSHSKTKFEIKTVETFPSELRPDGTAVYGDMETIRCTRCGEYMSMGTANDDGFVEIEIEAAEATAACAVTRITPDSLSDFIAKLEGPSGDPLGGAAYSWDKWNVARLTLFDDQNGGDLDASECQTDDVSSDVPSDEG